MNTKFLIFTFLLLGLVACETTLRRNKHKKNQWPEFVDKALNKQFKFDTAKWTVTNSATRQSFEMDAKVAVESLGIFVEKPAQLSADQLKFFKDVLACNQQNQCLLDFRLFKNCDLKYNEGGLLQWEGQSITFTALNLEAAGQKVEYTVKLYYKLGSGFFGGVNVQDISGKWLQVCTARRQALNTAKTNFKTTGTNYYNKLQTQQTAAKTNQAAQAASMVAQAEVDVTNTSIRNNEQQLAASQGKTQAIVARQAAAKAALAQAEADLAANAAEIKSFNDAIANLKTQLSTQQGVLAQSKTAAAAAQQAQTQADKDVASLLQQFQAAQTTFVQSAEQAKDVINGAVGKVKENKHGEVVDAAVRINAKKRRRAHRRRH